MKLIVSKERKGTNIYNTLSDCFKFVNDTKFNGTIIVESGIYKEKIHANLQNINIIGMSDSVIFTYDDWAGKYNSNGVMIGTTNSASFTLDENSENVYFENITFENSYEKSGTSENTQAVAYKSLGDMIIYKNCSFIGKQDTLYLDEGRHQLIDCYIQGTVDFIFGGAVALFEHCTIVSLQKTGFPQGYITAARTNHNLLENFHPYGFVFSDCELQHNISIDTKEINKVYLGRPWRNAPSVIFINCFLDQHISEYGWCDMKENLLHNAKFYEYHNYGGGSKKHPNRNQLTDEEASKIDFNTIFNNSSFSRKWE